MIFFLCLTAIVLLAYAAAGYFVFRMACLRGKELDWMDSEVVAVSPYKPYVDIIPMASRWLRQNHAQDVWTQSHDDLKLHGWWIPAENAKGSMLMFHGYRSTYLVDFAAVYELYHTQGYNILLADQRSHGQSEGKYITFGAKECRDAAAWIDYHNRTFGPIPVFLCGLSMGASTVLFAAGNPLPLNVRGITADCGFTSPYAIIRHVATKTVGPLANVLMPMVNFWARQLALFDLKECSTEKALAKCPVPLLMCHGLADDYVPSHMTQAGYDACTGEKELILVEGAGHGTSFLHDRQRVEKALLDFFRRNTPTE